MELLYLGTALTNGKYFLHSKFKNVHNYSNNKTIISLVQAEIGNGPSNIVVKKLPSSAENSLIIEDDKLKIGNNTIRIDTLLTKEIQNIYPNSQQELLGMVNILLKEIQFQSKSLGFLLFPLADYSFTSTFEKAFVQRVKDNVRVFSYSNLSTIASKMRGIGFGLTPSGDDFNCGMLYAFHYLKDIIDADLTTIIDEYYSKTLGTNLISNTFLKSAYLGLYYEYFYKLLLALKKDNEQEVLFYRDKVLDSGHSSGSDMLVGFIYCIKRLIINI